MQKKITLQHRSCPILLKLSEREHVRDTVWYIYTIYFILVCKGRQTL